MSLFRTYILRNAHYEINSCQQKKSPGLQKCYGLTKSCGWEDVPTKRNIFQISNKNIKPVQNRHKWRLNNVRAVFLVTENLENFHLKTWSAVFMFPWLRLSEWVHLRISDAETNVVLNFFSPKNKQDLQM